MKKEDALNVAVANYIRLQYPSVFFAHLPNGGSRNIIEAVKLKRMGVRKGMPDLMLFHRKYFKDKSTYAGLFIELKIKPNKPTDEQMFAMSELRKNGWNGGVCYDFESAKLLIDSYILN